METSLFNETFDQGMAAIGRIIVDNDYFLLNRKSQQIMRVLRIQEDSLNMGMMIDVSLSAIPALPKFGEDRIQSGIIDLGIDLLQSIIK